ncbi:AP2 domain-containing protein [bacterium]|nr:AP2 domain-containing protein [bacterium]
METTTATENALTAASVKKCKKCEVEKGVVEFSHHSGTRDKLDPRCKACVRLVRKNEDRVLKPRELDVMPTDATCREWQGGKKKGTIINKGDGLFMARVVNKKNRSFRLRDYDMDESRLKHAANSFLYETSLELGLTSNRYKIIFDEAGPTPQYLLVELSKNFVMLCDYDQLDFVKSHHLCVSVSGGKNPHKSHYAVYLAEDGKMSTFHKAITGFEMTDHINRYPMDNRRCNLRETNATDNNGNRTNYCQPTEQINTSVDFDAQREVWNARAEVNGKTKQVTFSLKTYSYEEGKLRAHKWVQEMSDKSTTHPMTGVVFDGVNMVFRSRIRVGDQQLERRFSVTKLGHDTAREMAVAWRTDMAKATDNHVSRPDEIPVHSHPDYPHLRSDFERIMLAHAGGLQWKS